MSSDYALLVDGTDLASISGITVGDMSGLLAPMTRRGSDDVIPGRRGQLGTPGQQLDAYAFSIPITILDGDSVGLITALAALGALFSGSGYDGLVTLERHLPKSGGGYTAYIADGRYVAFNSLQLLNPFTGKTELQFVNLSGAWKNTISGIWHVP